MIDKTTGATAVYMDLYKFGLSTVGIHKKCTELQRVLDGWGRRLPLPHACVQVH